MLDWQSVTIAGSCLPLTAVAFLKAHSAARRDRSFEVEEITEVPPTDVNRRMLGLSIAGWAPVVLSLVVVAFGVGLSLLVDPAGSLRFTELAVGPLVVALGHVVGVALGRWAPHPLVAPLTLIIAAALFLIADLLPGARTIPAASPFLPWRKPYTEWLQGEPREPLVHLLYLAGLIGVATGVAARYYRLLVGSGVAVVVASFVLAGIPSGGVDVSTAVMKWEAAQPRTCEVHRGIQVCPIVGYEPWFDDWFKTIDGLAELVPVPLKLREIRQTASPPFADTDPTVAHVGGSWDGAASDDAKRLAAQVLTAEMGLPLTAAELAEMNTDVPACMAPVRPLLISGQARGIGLLVLSELAVPESVDRRPFPGPVQFGQIELSRSEVDLALRIADEPREDVLLTLHAHWEKLIDPATTTATLSAWFGLEPPEILSTSSFDEMTCVCSPDGGVSCSSKEASDR
ncbi:MAG: hypothetical protein WD274_07720 [Acidimicrobiia bacterium]